ncbi:hypothetical protein [Thermaurantiacus sp.]|uniref:hypothetical protein n=1 Tax=Thermaurantiacus sp. TaxID=2820283 RepID=UPI00298EF17C|nr:hypothetical protein [Thermaurantiacus sp.]
MLRSRPAAALVRHRRVRAIVGDQLVVEVPETAHPDQTPALGDLALVREDAPLTRSALAEVVRI